MRPSLCAASTHPPGRLTVSVSPAQTHPGATQAGPTSEDAPVQKFDPNFQPQVSYHERAAAPHCQSCNDHVCLPPTDVALPVSLAAAVGAVRAAASRSSPSR